jgi:mRNA-degrading endonuclease toxin of MazEF toxin-antitoxin module
MRKVPERGEIWHLDLNPTAGHEQQGARPVLILSPRDFNRSGLALICPTTQGGHGARFSGFAVPLINSGTETQGVVLCNQSGTIDFVARRARFVESVPDYLVDEAIARVQTLLD